MTDAVPQFLSINLTGHQSSVDTQEDISLVSMDPPRNYLPIGTIHDGKLGEYLTHTYRSIPKATDNHLCSPEFERKHLSSIQQPKNIHLLNNENQSHFLLSGNAGLLKEQLQSLVITGKEMKHGQPILSQLNHFYCNNKNLLCQRPSEKDFQKGDNLTVLHGLPEYFTQWWSLHKQSLALGEYHGHQSKAICMWHSLSDPMGVHFKQKKQAPKGGAFSQKSLLPMR